MKRLFLFTFWVLAGGGLCLLFLGHFLRVPTIGSLLSQNSITVIAGIVLAVAGGIDYWVRRSWARTNTTSNVNDSPKSENAPDSHVMEAIRSDLQELRMRGFLRPAAQDRVDLSIVIPAYNEESRLPRTLREIILWCSTQNLEFELIIADDGSRDATLGLARLFEKADDRVRALSCPHMGKGSAVRFGVLNTKGNIVLFMDADGATPLDEIPKLMTALKAGNDVAVGSRAMQQAGTVKVKTSVHRRLMGRIFAFVVSVLTVNGIADTQCGFKAFGHEAALAIFSLQKTAGFAFDVEVLFIARRLSLTIAEIPVNWVAQPGSKVNLVTDSLKMLWDISLIRLWHRNLHVKYPVRHLGQSLNSGREVS